MAKNQTEPVATKHPVDIHIGRRIRAIRMGSGLSQSALSDRIGLTFQQVQKYERGVNRVSGSKLYETAVALGVPVSAFFEGLAGTGGQAHRSSAILSAYEQLPPAIQRAACRLLLELVRPFSCTHGNRKGRPIMAETHEKGAQSFTFYTYVYGCDLSQTTRRYYETEEMARCDLTALRRTLLSEADRRHPLRDMSIVRLETVPVNGPTLVALFNDLDGGHGAFIRSREIVATIREPQVALLD